MRSASGTTRSRLRSDAAAESRSSALGGLLLCGLAVWIAAPESASIASIVRETFAALLWQPGPLDFHDELGARRRGGRRHRPARARRGASGLLLPAARRAALAPGRRRAPRRPARSCAATAPTRSPTSSSAATSTTSSAPTAAPSSATGSRRACCSSPATRSARPTRCPALLPRAQRRSPRRAAWSSRRSASASACCRSGGSSACARSTSATRASSTPRAFSLEGRAIRKVRQSVSRLEKAGLHGRAASRSAELDEAELAELERGQPQLAAGRSRARLRDVARRAPPRRPRRQPRAARPRRARAASAASSTSRRATGRPAVSLSLMRRDRDTPNGLTEFLVVRGDRAAARPRRRGGLAQLRGLRAAHPRAARAASSALVGRACCWPTRFFQIERLYRFNAKFFPRWEPRYLVYERRLGLPRVGTGGSVGGGPAAEAPATLASIAVRRLERDPEAERGQRQLGQDAPPRAPTRARARTPR